MSLEIRPDLRTTPAPLQKEDDCPAQKMTAAERLRLDRMCWVESGYEDTFEQWQKEY